MRSIILNGLDYFPNLALFYMIFIYLRLYDLYPRYCSLNLGFIILIVYLTYSQMNPNRIELGCLDGAHLYNRDNYK
jgi:hypothetical protein